MMKSFWILLIAFSVPPAMIAQDLIIPSQYTLVDSVAGDLDNDGINELAVAYNTKPSKEEFEGVPRELIIYKMKGGSWTAWKKSLQALYGSRDGGMMGDPFGEMDIKNGVLSISHNGGSSWKWDHTDKYRYQQGELYLIGYTSNAGKPCEHWQNVDFNLMTGKLVVTKEYEDCEKDQQIYKRENETMIKKGIRLTIQNRIDKEILIITPKYKHEIYLAIKPE